VEAGQVWRLSVRAGQLLDERDAVLRVMRAQARSATAARAAAAAAGADGPRINAGTSPADGSVPPMPPRTPTPRSTADAARRPGLDVHGVLVGLGALLLSVAALGFLVFSWRVLSLPGRAAVIAVVTLGVLTTASWLRGRLPETAEAVGGLAVVLVLADCWAIRRTGLFGADQPQALSYAAAASAICALLLGGWAVITGVRAGSWAAVVLAPLGVLLLAARLDGDLGPVPVSQSGFLLVAGLAAGRALLPAGWRAERWLLRVIAAGALLAVGGSAGFVQPGPGRAALLLAVAALAAGAEAVADRSGPVAELSGPVAKRSGPVAELSGSVAERDRLLLLRRAWSFAAGLLAGLAATQASLALIAVLELNDVTRLIPLTALPALAVVAAAGTPSVPGAAIRRTAVGAGTVLIAAVAAVPVIGLAGWLPLRVALVGGNAWSAEPGNRLRDLDPQPGGSLAAWAVTLIGLVIVGGCGLLAMRISDWPAWLRRPVRFAAVGAGGGVVLVLPLLPIAPVIAVVGVLTGCSVLLPVVLLARPSWLDGRLAGGPAKGWTIAGWTASLLTGTLAVLLAWSCRDLSVPLTALGILGLLLLRRRASAAAGPAASADPSPAATSTFRRLRPTMSRSAALAGLAGFAGCAAPFAVAASADLAGAPESMRAVWAGLIGGLSVAALIGLPRWLPAARPGRAPWTGADRSAAAAPGLLALIVGLLATLLDGWASAADSTTWARAALLAVALLIGLTGAGAVRPDVARTLPVLPPLAALVIAPLLGALAAAVANAASTGPAWSLLWAGAATVTALGTAAVVLSGRADPIRRVAAEVGVLLAGLVGLVQVGSQQELWPVLLMLGAGAAAIAATANRQRIGWLAGALLTASTWTRLDLGNVTVVEAYSLPPAIALLGLALYRLRRDREADPGAVLIPVATVGLAPSIVVAANGGSLRPALLLVAAAALILAGWLLQRRNEPASAAEPTPSSGAAPTSGSRSGPNAGLLLASALAGIGVLTAAGTAIARAGSILWAAFDPAIETLAVPGGTRVPFSGVELWTLPAAGLLLVAALTMDRHHQVPPSPGSGRVPGTRRLPAAPPLLLSLLLAGVPTLLAAMFTVGEAGLGGPWAVPRAAAVLGLSALALLAALAGRPAADRCWRAWSSSAGRAWIESDRFRQARIGLEPGAVALAVAATWSGLPAGSVEAWTLPLAVLLLLQGWFRFEHFGSVGARPGGFARSWAAYAPGLVVLLFPSLDLDLRSTNGSPLREIGLIALAGATVVLGSRYRLQAPVLLGTGVLAVQAVLLLRPWIAELSGAVPVWGWLAAVGLGLILFGARYEARIRQLRTVRLRLATLR
jgi:hypothetical protein